MTILYLVMRCSNSGASGLFLVDAALHNRVIKNCLYTVGSAENVDYIDKWNVQYSELL